MTPTTAETSAARGSRTDNRAHVVVFTDAGGGHRAVAEALAETLGATDGVRVTLVNAYQRVLPHLDLFARYSSRTVEQTYNDLIMRDGRTGLFCLGFYALAFLNVRVLSPAGRRAFLSLWEEIRPDLVISVLPLINPLMIDSLKRYRDGATPFAVLMTDWAELTRTVWFPHRRDYHIICSTEPGYRQAVPSATHRTVRTGLRACRSGLRSLRRGQRTSVKPAAAAAWTLTGRWPACSMGHRAVGGCMGLRRL